MKQRVSLSWGDLTQHKAEKFIGGDFPAYTARRAYIPLQFFARFVDVEEALSAALVKGRVLPRRKGGPASITVLDPPKLKDLPEFVEIEHEQ